MDDLNARRRPGIISLLIRVVVNAVVLLIISYLTPGFYLSGIWTAIIAAAVIGILDYLINIIFKIDASPFGRGISGFLIAALVLYLSQALVPGFSVSLWGALIGALFIGLVDLIIPGRIM